jgi:hypothetical protein
MRIPERAKAWIGAGLALVVAAGFFAWSKKLPPFAHSAPPTTLPALHAPGLADDPIDGEPVPQELAGRRPVAVVIDNYPNARPQWGLSAAARVYEILTEGGITRYLAIFGPRDLDRVGPIRSTRTQFLNYVLELDAVLAHVGGNADALDLIPGLRLKSLDEFRYATAYRRILKSKVAFEHTMFTSTTALRELIDRNGWGKTGAVDHPAWKDDIPPTLRPESHEVTLDFSFPQYRVSWVYQPGTNVYARNVVGTPDVDAATGSVITAKSIVIAVVGRVNGRTRLREDTWTFADIGSGRAWVVQDGTVTAGTWQKTSREGRLRFYDPDGNEIAFDRGPQWVEIIPPEVTPLFRDPQPRTP